MTQFVVVDIIKFEIKIQMKHESFDILPLFSPLFFHFPSPTLALFKFDCYPISLPSPWKNIVIISDLPWVIALFDLYTRLIATNVMMP